MKPFYFGGADKSLFGIYHPSQAKPARPCGIVLCNPMGQEYIRSHRALRLLATRLTAAGFHVLRFDYHGCGDSAGESQEASLEQWQADIAQAIDEIKKAGRVTKVALIGLRLGASLSLLTSAGRSDVEQLVLWEPVVNGAHYVQKLLQQHQQWLREALHKPKTTAAQNGEEVLGFPFPSHLRQNLAALNLLMLDPPFAKQILLVAHEEKVEDVELKQHLKQARAQVEYQIIPGLKVWGKQGGADKGVVPIQILQSLVSWMSKAEP